MNEWTSDITDHLNLFDQKKYVLTFLQEQLAPLQILGAIPEHNRDQCDSYAVTRDVP